MYDNTTHLLELLSNAPKDYTEGIRSLDFSWHRRAQDCIAHGALTNSKRPECLGIGAYPTHLERAHGCEVSDGKNTYVDYICGLGTNLLGYGNPVIAREVMSQAASGITLSLGTKLEVEVAEMCKEIWPFLERLRFLKTGTEACMAAIRIARAYTKRNLILSEGYHGHADEFISLTPPALGVPSGSNIEKLDFSMIPDAAAVIVEPVITDYSDERKKWLFSLRDECNRHGTVLIFDEIITGLRFKDFSVSKYWGVFPDMACFGKAIAGGLPLSIVGGKQEIMECGEYFVSSTFAGDTVSLGACKKTLESVQSRYDINHLWRNGKLFQEKFNALWPQAVSIQGYPTRGVFVGSEEFKCAFFEHAAKAGLLFGPSWFFCFPHIAITDAVIKGCENILLRIKNGELKRTIPLPKKPFAQEVRDDLPEV